MTSFSEAALEQKLAELNNSQQSIQTLSLWVIHHRKHCKTIVSVWYKELLKAKPSRKLTFMYLANDVIQNSKKKGPEYAKEFGNVLSKAFQFVGKSSDQKTEHGLNRLLNVWQERGVYSPAQLESFRNSIKKIAPSSKSKNEEKPLVKKTRKHRESNTVFVVPSPPGAPADEEITAVTAPERSPCKEPPDIEVLIKSILDLENSASSDAAVREKIASLPPEVSDVSLLERLRDKEDGEKLEKQVSEACSLLEDYNSRLAQELEERKQVAKMLSDFIYCQKELLTKEEQKLEDCQQKLQKVNQVRGELKSHIQNLPDLTLLPDVTGGLAPLPSAGDLFNLGQ